MTNLTITDHGYRGWPSDEPIGEIAGRVGYDEVAYFSRCFRAQMKRSPSEYRDAYKGAS